MERRNLNQKTAHVIMGFNTRELANQTIEASLIIENKKVFVEKLLIEPSRCFNCQSVKGDHRTAYCPNKHPTCARCAGEHTTTSCTHMGTPRCVNCKAEGHSAADHSCPSFESSTAHYRRFTPDSKYHFYPIETDTYTWEPNATEAYVGFEPGPPNWEKEAHAASWKAPVTGSLSEYDAMQIDGSDRSQRTPRQRDLRQTVLPSSWVDMSEILHSRSQTKMFPTPTSSNSSSSS
jgi:hypothetical protein